MKIIYPNIITAVTASSELTQYPATNLLTENIGLVWKSTASIYAPSPATIEFDDIVLKDEEYAIGIFGIENYPGISVSFAFDESPGYIETQSDNIIDNRFWYAFMSQATESVTVTITLSSRMSYQVSEVVFGKTITIRDPQYGVTQTRIDKSIKQELAGGGYYIHDALKPRTFGLSWIMGRDDEFESLDSLYNIRGSKPLAMLIAENLNDDMKWCGYFHMTDAPTATHDMPSHSAVSLSLREAC